MMKRSKREGSLRAQNMGIAECTEGKRRGLSNTKRWTEVWGHGALWLSAWGNWGMKTLRKGLEGTGP